MAGGSVAQRRGSTPARGRRWCFTLNNPTDAECAGLIDRSDVPRYMVIGDEIGENGTPHLQGYMVVDSPWRFSRVKKFIFERSHVELAKGSSAENRTYCIKSGKFEEYGDCPLDDKGKSETESNKWLVARDLAIQGKFMEIEPSLYIRYMSSFHKIHIRYGDEPARIDEMCNDWFYGDSGSGKSRSASDLYPGCYRKPLNKWWDGYKGQAVVLIEDIGKREAQWITSFLKVWTDHYPFEAEFKGGSMRIRPTKYVVTSNYSIRDLFSDQEDFLALERRFKLKHFGRGVGDASYDSAMSDGPRWPGCLTRVTNTTITPESSQVPDEEDYEVPLSQPLTDLSHPSHLIHAHLSDLDE